MALLFMDGFDHYATADCTKKYDFIETAGTTFLITSNAGRRSTGGFVARASSGGSAHSRLHKNIPNSSVVYVGVAVKFSTAPSSNAFIIRFVDGTTFQSGIYITPTMHIGISNAAGTGLTGGLSANPISVNTFVYVEAKMTIANSISTDDCILRVNGVQVASATAGDTQSTANAYATRISIGAGSGDGFAHTATFDDFYICDATGSTNNNFLGDCIVETIRPNADGFYTDGTPSTGSSHYELVDDTVPNLSDYVTLPDVGDRDSFGFTNLTPLSSRVVYGVQANAAVAKDDAGSRSVATFTRSGTTDESGTAKSLSDDQVYCSQLIQTDPNTGTGWTQSSVNDAQFGLVVTA
jgi:hypothetical protein